MGLAKELFELDYLCVCS